MSDTVKLIIELPTDKYLSVKTNIINDFIYDAVKHGIPLDDVKAEIETDLSGDMFDDYGNETDLHKVLWEILDNVGKAESEDKE